MPQLALHLLGPPRIERDGEPVEISRRKAIALLVYLAVAGPGSGGQSRSRDALATLLWPESDQSRARAGLRRTLAALKKALGEGWLDVDRDTVALSRDAAVWLDVAEFRDRLAECGTHGHSQEETCPACLSLLGEAVELYRDDFLAGFTLRDAPAFDDWQFFQTEGLRDELAKALQRLAHGYGGRGEYEPAIVYARRWLALDPLCEPAHLHLMLLYARSGQRAAALRQYGECERVLKEELGVPPQEETTQVYEAIKENQELPPLAAPAASQTDAHKHNLPVQLTPFVGREALLAEIAERLQDPDCRLLTLVGPGGSGKTRLALEVAGGQLDSYTHGVYFVPLAPLRSADAIVPTVADALGFRFYTAAGGGADAGGGAQIDPRQQLLGYLRQKRMLIIMDNFEHLLDGAEVVIDILKTAPDVKILATSRAGLSVQGEHLFPIAGMDVPESRTATDAGQYSAVKLFVTSACRAKPDFELTEENVSDVIRTCRLVEGMPLGILLAAAWLETLAPAEIAHQVDQSIGFLETDLRDVPERHRSIRAVFDHSWNLLTEREQEVFQALSVFRGGFTHQAAEQIAGASLQDLRGLVSKSMLQRTPAGRYDVHELLRQYAEEKLDHSTDVSWAAHDRHCDYYIAALRQFEIDLKSPRQAKALAEMDAEIENARAAWDWAVTHAQAKRLARAVEGLSEFSRTRWRVRDAEAACRAAAEKLAEIEKSPPAQTDECLRVLARLLARQADFQFVRTRQVADQLLRHSLDILDRLEAIGHDTRADRAFVLMTMGGVQSLEQSLALYREVNDRWWTAYALDRLGWAAMWGGDSDEVRLFLEESLALFQELGDGWRVARGLTALGLCALLQGQLDEAERLLDEGFAIRQKAGLQAPDDISILFSLSHVHFQRGGFAAAHSVLKRCLAISCDLASGLMRSRYIIATNLYLSDVEMHLGWYEQAQTRARTNLALAREVDYPGILSRCLSALGNLALRAGTYAEAYQLLKESSETWRRAVAVIWYLSSILSALGYAAYKLGDASEAWHHVRKALQALGQIRDLRPLLYVLSTVALLLADQGEKEQAVELYALASRYPLVANSRWFEDVAGKHIAAVAATLPPEVVAAAQERGRARDLNATVAELLAELSEK